MVTNKSYFALQLEICDDIWFKLSRVKHEQYQTGVNIRRENFPVDRFFKNSYGRQTIYLYQKCKNWGVKDFVFEAKLVETYPDFEKLAQVLGFID